MIPKKWIPYFPSEWPEGIKTILSDEEITPKKENIFRAFELIDPENVKIVVLGQDPYPDPTCATGVAFAVPKGVKTPPSLKNIHKNLEKFGHSVPDNLEEWCAKGVLLMNCSLTLSNGKSNSHAKLWNPIMRGVIDKLTKEQNPMFILLGAFAIKQYSGTNFTACSHPSPLSATKKCGNYESFMNTDVFAQIFTL